MPRFHPAPHIRAPHRTIASRLRYVVAAAVIAVGIAACGDGDAREGGRFGLKPLGAPPEDASVEASVTPQPAQGGSESRDSNPPPAATREPDPEPREPQELLPDLEVMPPRELYIEEGADVRKIRFSTTIANTGEGPLDIAGSYDPGEGITTATQRIARDDGSVNEEIAGRFLFHPGHEHWHFEDFTMLELWTYDGGGDLVDMKATTGKATFCAVDEVLEYDDLEHVPDGPAYLECGAGVQGISVGWSDTYTADLIGQELDITGVPDGSYAVRTVADPAGRLRETNDDNNDLIVYVDLEGGAIELRDGP